MARPDREAASDAGGTRLRLRLYVAGNAPNSARARVNLQAVCRDLPAGTVEIDEVDVLREPLRALEDQVLVTPTLRKLAPLPQVQIIGDLSDSAQVRLALGIGGPDA